VCACARALLHNNNNIKFYIIVIIMIVKNIRTQVLVCVCVCVRVCIIVRDAVCRAHNGGTRVRRRDDVRAGGVCVCVRVRVVDAWLAGARAVTGTRAPRGASNARVLPNFSDVVLNFLVPPPIILTAHVRVCVCACILFIYTTTTTTATTTCVPVALRRDSWLARASFGPEQFGANSRG